MKRATWTLGVACLLLVGGCEVVTGLNGARVGDGDSDGGSQGFLPACGTRGLLQPRTFRLEMLNMPHVGQLVEVEVISTDAGFTQGIAILDPLPTANYTVTLPNLLDPGVYGVEFYADLNRDRMYTVAPADHTWRRIVGPNGCFTFPHTMPFEDLRFGRPVGGPATLTLTDFDADIGLPIEARLIQEGARRRVVGLYRLNRIASASFTIAIPKLIDAGSGYTFEVYVDECADPMGGCTTGTFGRFEPEFDNSWVVTDLVGGVAGLDATLSGAAPTQDLSYP